MNDKPKLLIFEDEPFTGEMYKTKFQDVGFEVALYENPSIDPVSLILKEKPDLIIISVIMPVMDGFVATKLIKDDPRTKDIPLVFFTNLGGDEDIKKGLALGAVAYWLKSKYTPGEIVRRIKAVLNLPIEESDYSAIEQNPSLYDPKPGSHVPSFFDLPLEDEVSKKKYKILLFEDDPSLAEMWKTKLEQAGYEVAWHVDPSTNPVGTVTTEKPDLILMSIIMPTMDGFNATKLLKADNQTKNIPIIALTNLGQEEEIRKGIELGMVHYLITSRYTPQELVDFIQNFFNKEPGLKGDEL